MSWLCAGVQSWWYSRGRSSCLADPEDVGDDFGSIGEFDEEGEIVKDDSYVQSYRFNELKLILEP